MYIYIYVYIERYIDIPGMLAVLLTGLGQG